MGSLHPNSAEISALIEKYSSLLLRVGYSYLKNIQDVEDMVQDTFIKVIQKNITFDNEEHEKAWLIRVTINHCKNHLKTAWYRTTIPLDEDIGFTQEESEVMEAVSQLPEKYRSVIVLYYVVGYSIKEIAQLLKRKEATVSSQLQRARNQLKAKLKEDFDYE
jgi:RNA polymerase sigma-70 factor (ECF subfamily)